MPSQDPGFQGDIEQLQLGFGYNTARHEMNGTSLVAWTAGAAAGTPITVAANSESSSNATIRLVTCQEDVETTIGASAKGKYNGGDYSVSAAASFSDAFSFNETTLNYLVMVEVLSGSLTIQQPTLSGPAGQTLFNPSAAPGTNALGAFNVYRTYGDSYVSSVTRGMYLYAQIEMLFESMQDKIEAQEQIGFSGVGSSFDASSTQSYSKSMSKARMTINVYTIGDALVSVPRTLDDLLSQADTFESSDVVSDGVVVDYGIDPISSLDGYNNPATSLAARDTALLAVVQDGLRYLSIIDQVEDMIANPAHYQKCPSQINLQSLLSLANQYFDNVSTIAQSYTKPGSIDGETYQDAGEFLSFNVHGAQLPLPYSNLTDTSQPSMQTFTGVTTFIPVATHLGGGDDMDGKPTTVTVNATYAVQAVMAGRPPTQVLGSFGFDFKSQNGTELAGNATALLYTAPAGLYIAGCGAVPSTNLQVLVEKTTHSYTTIGLATGTSGTVPTLTSADCLLDTQGADVGKLFATNLAFSQVPLTFGHVEDFKAS